MKVIHKFPLEIKDGLQIISFPIGSEIIAFKNQLGQAVMYILFDPEPKASIPHHFRVVATGQIIEDDNIKYIGSEVGNEGMLVFHLIQILGLND